MGSHPSPLLDWVLSKVRSLSHQPVSPGPAQVYTEEAVVVVSQGND